MLGTAFFLWLGLSTANFMYQYFSKERNWGVATERSLYQAVALLMLVLIVSVKH
jgi:hypothetical protein